FFINHQLSDRVLVRCIQYSLELDSLATQASRVRCQPESQEIEEGLEEGDELLKRRFGDLLGDIPARSGSKVHLRRHRAGGHIPYGEGVSGRDDLADESPGGSGVGVIVVGRIKVSQYAIPKRPEVFCQSHGLSQR